jgi:hypothetical protein
MVVEEQRYYRYKITKFNEQKKVIDRIFFTSLKSAADYCNIKPCTLQYQLKNTKHKSDKWRLMRLQKCHIDRQVVSLYSYTFDTNTDDDYYSTDDEND